MSEFWNDVEARMLDPEFQAELYKVAHDIAAIDAMVNETAARSGQN